MANTFLTPKTIVSGKNALDDAGKLLGGFGRKAFVVTDATMVKLGNADLLLKVLDAQGIEYSVFPEVNFEPNDIIVKQGAEAYKASGCDFLIALGGGSPIDTAKAISILWLPFQQQPVPVQKLPSSRSSTIPKQR